MTIQELRERAAACAQEIRNLVEKNNDKWTADLQAKYDAGMAEIEDIKAQIDRTQKADSLLADNKDFDSVGDAYARSRIAGGGTIATVDNDRAMFVNYLRNGFRDFNAQDMQRVRNTMSTTTGAQGGFTVQTVVAKEVVEALKAYGGMRQAATVFQTSMGNDILFPTSDGTGEVGELIGQNTTASAQDPAFTGVTLSVYKYSSKVVAIPFELLQDSQIDVEAFVRKRLVTRVGRITNTHFTVGTGTGQPNGVVTASTAGKVGLTGQTVSVIFDDLIDMVHSVDPAYRMLGNCKWMMNDASLKLIRKLKDSQGRPVFLPGYDGLAGSMPDTLLGYPIVINQDVPVMAANAKSILFGDFSFYNIRDVMDVTLFRFDDSAYAKLGQVGFLMWMRSGGNLIGLGNEIKYYQNSAT